MADRPTDEEREFLLAGLDHACELAAEAISQADVLLLCTGAGFSADSGLAIYADVARVGAYAERGLQYHDLCQPHWLHDKPEIFWGFWGQCFNDYRSTSPHEGYAMIDRWADQRFRRSTVAQSIRREMEQRLLGQRLLGGHGLRAQETPSSPVTYEPYAVKDMPGAFFAFTSNVDAHHYDWFPAGEIRECHGNTELLQCGAEGPCSPAVWRAPADLRFVVDRLTMLAPSARPGDSAAQALSRQAGLMQQGEAGRGNCVPDDSEGDEGVQGRVPKIGNVRGGGRSTALRHMPDPPIAAGPRHVGFDSNHPRCRSCGGPARPAILMFGDVHWGDLEQQHDRWEAWLACVERHAKRERVRIAILEIGAGDNVPTVRWTAESCCKRFLLAGADARLIRVNPELPLGDNHFAPGGFFEDRLISVMSRGLSALHRIDEALKSKIQGKAESACSGSPISSSISGNEDCSRSDMSIGALEQRYQDVFGDEVEHQGAE